MSQLIYSVAALAAVTLFTVSLHRAGISVEQEVYIIEARSRLLGVARETGEQISRMDLPFDSNTDPDLLGESAQFPYVSSPSELTPEGSFGGCNDIAYCLDLDDFSGITFSDTANGLPYEVAIKVTYADTVDGSYSSSQTYSKDLKITVSTEAVRIGNEPLSITYNRLFAFPSLMDFARGAQTL